jgi:hypothetical protein
MEQADQTLFPLDLAGITVVNAEGDGNLEAMGSFFQSLGIPALPYLTARKGRMTKSQRSLRTSRAQRKSHTREQKL